MAVASDFQLAPPAELYEKLAKENRQGSIALRGEILLMVEGKTVLVKN